MDRAADLSAEIERYASFDLATRRFIAYAIWQVPELRPLVGREKAIGGNEPMAFEVSSAEEAERIEAYANLTLLRGCTEKGEAGQRQRCMHFGALMEPAKVDLKWKRLTSLPAFFFCYERLVGPAWRQLLSLAWHEAALNRRKKAPLRQLPLDPRLRDDASVPYLLENEPAPWFFPSLADADQAGGTPLLSML